MKKRSIKSYVDLPPQLVKQLDNEYPYGFDEELFEVKGKDEGTSCKAMWYETDEVMYLIKFDKYLNNKTQASSSDYDEDEDIDDDDDDVDEVESDEMDADEIDEDLDDDD